MAERSRDWFRQAVHDLVHARGSLGAGDLLLESVGRPADAVVLTAAEG